MNYFESPFSGKPIKDQVTNSNIIVGRHSYYSGYYHSHSFDDCARYLMPDRDDVDQLIIGNFCSIGSGAAFLMAGNQGHRSSWISTFPFYYLGEQFEGATDGYQKAGDTIIGHDVWIGTEALILPGIKVGNGAIIASRAVVSKNVQPYEIVGSNPAKHIRYRFEACEIAMLCEMQWWHWSDEQIKNCMQLFCATDILALHAHWKRHIAS